MIDSEAYQHLKVIMMIWPSFLLTQIYSGVYKTLKNEDTHSAFNWQSPGLYPYLHQQNFTPHLPFCNQQQHTLDFITPCNQSTKPQVPTSIHLLGQPLGGPIFSNFFLDKATKVFEINTRHLTTRIQHRQSHKALCFKLSHSHLITPSTFSWCISQYKPQWSTPRQQ